jgi:hypothetical protein
MMVIIIGDMPSKKTASDYHKVAKKAGLVWLGPIVKNTQTKTRWRCQKDHEWNSIYSTIQQGHGCPYCAKVLPKTPNEYHELAKYRGFIWLGPEVKNVNTKTNWQCAKGHKWGAVYANIQQGYGCPICGGSLRKEPADFEALAKSKGLEWLGPVVSNNKTKTNWRCNVGHVWEAPYSSIQQDNQCYLCQKNTSKSVKDYHTLAKSRGFEWLGPEVPSAQAKTFWKCSKKHTWPATYSKIKSGRGCPYCSRRVSKTKEDYKKLAEKKGFKWIGSKLVNTHLKTLWQCSQKHKWPASYHSLATGNTGCPYCAGSIPKKPEDYHRLAKTHGFKWHGPDAPNVMTKTWWECPNGHRWYSTYSMINSGYGCTQCLDIVNGKLVSSPQRKIAKMIGGLLNVQVGKYVVDIALQKDEQLIAIEYDAWYWHGDRQKYDIHRDKSLNDDDWKVIRIKSGKLLPDTHQLENSIKELLNGKWYVEIVLDDWGKGNTATNGKNPF